MDIILFFKSHAFTESVNALYTYFILLNYLMNFYVSILERFYVFLPIMKNTCLKIFTFWRWDNVKNINLVTWEAILLDNRRNDYSKKVYEPHPLITFQIFFIFVILKYNPFYQGPFKYFVNHFAHII